MDINIGHRILLSEEKYNMNVYELTILSKMFCAVFESNNVLWFSNNLHVALQTSVLCNLYFAKCLSR